MWGSGTQSRCFTTTWKITFLGKKYDFNLFPLIMKIEYTGNRARNTIDQTWLDNKKTQSIHTIFVVYGKVSVIRNYLSRLYYVIIKTSGIVS